MKKLFKTSMLEYCKIVLKKISFNRKLFIKEYKKTFTYLDTAEHDKLKQWLREVRIFQGPRNNFEYSQTRIESKG